MHFGGQLFRSLAACGLTLALFACGVTAHAQAVSGSPGAGGPLGPGSGGTGGFGITANPSPAGSNSFAGGNPGNFPGNGGGFGGNNGATFRALSGTGNLGGGTPSGGGGASNTGGTGAILALTFYAVPVNSPSSAPPLPGRLSPGLRNLISRSDSISAETARDLTVAYDARGTLVLRGTVASPAEGRALESLIRFAPGVTGVRNEMTLRGP